MNELPTMKDVFENRGQPGAGWCPAVAKELVKFDSFILKASMDEELEL